MAPLEKLLLYMLAKFPSQSQRLEYVKQEITAIREDLSHYEQHITEWLANLVAIIRKE